MEKPDHPMIRTRLSAAHLGIAWREHAEGWVAWTRKPDHDSYWRFHRDQFLELIPPGTRTLDLGCGEGRLSRTLKSIGHDVTGVDVSATMLAAARDEDPSIPFILADAAQLPFEDGSFDRVVAFMSLQDIDDLGGAVRGAARVLGQNGCLCVAIVHPLNSAGAFLGDSADSAFTIDGSYLDCSFYADNIVRDGLEITFVSAHRPLAAYTDALHEAGLLIDLLREPPVPDSAITTPRQRRWTRVPLFLHLRALKM